MFVKLPTSDHDERLFCKCLFNFCFTTNLDLDEDLQGARLLLNLILLFCIICSVFDSSGSYYKK